MVWWCGGVVVTIFFVAVFGVRGYSSTSCAVSMKKHVAMQSLERGVVFLFRWFLFCFVCLFVFCFVCFNLSTSCCRKFAFFLGRGGCMDVANALAPLDSCMSRGRGVALLVVVVVVWWW